jgi:integrase
LFARAFAERCQGKLAKREDMPSRVNLAAVLREVCEAVESRFEGAKRVRILDSLSRYAHGQSYNMITRETGRARPQTSEDLREAERVSGLRIRKGASAASKRDLKTLIGDTRQKRSQGCHAASVWGWHNLRGTFVTLALNAGLPFETVVKCTGHATAKIVRDHYYNPTREHTKAAMKPIGERLSGKQPARLPVEDAVAVLAAQVKQLSKADRTRLSNLLRQ